MRLAQTDGGLLVPEGAQEAAIARALREHDDALRLVPQDSTYYGQRVYKVYRYNGPDRDADFILFWGDEHGNPYPLSHSIVDEVKRHDFGMRGFSVEDPDVLNARLLEQRRKDAREEGAELARYVQDRLDNRVHSVPHRGPALAAARRKARRRLPKELRP